MRNLQQAMSYNIQPHRQRSDDCQKKLTLASFLYSTLKKLRENGRSMKKKNILFAELSRLWRYDIHI